MLKHHAWMALAITALAAACGSHRGRESDPVETQRSALASIPYVSPDFAVNQDPAPQFNPSAKLLSVAASAAVGYLLAYEQPYAPGSWSRFALGNFNTYTAHNIVFTHWGATSGTPVTLASLPAPPQGSLFRNALVVDVGRGWLVVYELVTANKVARYSVTLARDGSLGEPIALPDPCGPLSTSLAMGDDMRGFVRGTDTALLTDGCGDGLLLDLDGHVLKRVSIANTSALPNWSGRTFVGGQVAFNGIDYLVVYAYPDFVTKYVWGFPISPAGEPGTAFAITTSIVSYKTASPLSLAANDHSFLLALAQGRTQGPETATTYRKVVEASDHTFSIAAERFVLGETVVGPGTSSDSDVNAFSLNGQFAITVEHNGLQIVYPSTDPELEDTTQSLPPLPSKFVTTADDSVAGTRVLMISDVHGVRLEGSLHVIDDPAVVLQTSTPGQFAPSFAFDRQGYIAAWTEGIGETAAPRIWGHRLSTTGGLVDPASFRINTDVGVEPLLTANPSHVVAVWSSQGTAFTGAAAIASADPPTVTPFVSPATLADDFGVTSDGSHSSIAWIDVDCGTGLCARSVRMVELAASGTWSPTLTIAATMSPTACPPALAFNAEQYAVLWTDAASTDGERVLYGARVSADMALLDPTPKELLRFRSRYPNGLPMDCGLTVISMGDHFLFAWADVTNATEEVRLARLSHTLEVLDPGGVLASTQPYTSIGATQHRVALGWDGTNAWALWRDGEAALRRPFASLRGRRFSDTLMPVDSDPFLISDDLDEFSKVTLAIGPDGAALVGYTRYLQSEGSFRVRARFLSSSLFAAGMPCNIAEQCQYGACVAGYCSNSIGAGGASGAGGESGGAVGSGGDGTGGVSAGGAAGGVSAGGAGGVSAGGAAGGVSAGGAAGGVSAGGAAGEGALSPAGGSDDVAGNANDGGSLGNASGAANAEDAGAGPAGAGAESTTPSSDTCGCRVAGGGPKREPLASLLGLSMIGALVSRRRAIARAARRVGASCR